MTLRVNVGREAYAKGWEDACSLAIARLSAFDTITVADALAELMLMAETGAHHPLNRPHAAV